MLKTKLYRVVCSRIHVRVFTKHFSRMFLAKNKNRCETSNVYLIFAIHVNGLQLKTVHVGLAIFRTNKMLPLPNTKQH